MKQKLKRDSDYDSPLFDPMFFARCQRFYDEMMFQVILMKMSGEDDEEYLLLSSLIEKFEMLFDDFLIKGPFLAHDEDL